MVEKIDFTKSGETDAAREYAETITTESERLSRLIDNVLEFSRLEQGSRDLRLEAGPLGPGGKEAARILEGDCPTAPGHDRHVVAVREVPGPSLVPEELQKLSWWTDERES